MGARDLLQHLRGAGFRLDVAGDKLMVAPAAALTDAQRQAIREHKPALIALLTKPASIIAAPVMPLPSGATGATVSDVWCWPQSDAMNGAEIDTFTKRLHLFARHGIDEAQADKLADLLVLRDRQLDDRHLCLECTSYRPGRCGNHRVARLHSPAVGRDLAALMQRCPGFRA